MNLRPIIRTVEALPNWQFVSYAGVAILVIGVIDHVTGPITSLTIFYLIPVAATAWFVSQRAANVLALFAAMAWAISDRIGPLAEPKSPIAFWNDVSILGVFVFVNVVVSAFRRQMQRERNLLLQVQKRLLPDLIPAIPGFDLAWRWMPAWIVAGDYYDLIHTGNDRYAICLADVSGKGMAAALIMANVQAPVHALTADDVAPHRMMAILNRSLSERLRTESFVTMFYGLLDATSGEFAFTNAGHNPPILVKADGRVTRLEPTGPVAGIFPLAAYRSADEQMAAGDYLVIFSDGVTEHKNRAGEEFGETRLTKTLLEAVDRSADEICTAIIDSLITFAGNRPYEDDVPIVVLRRAVTTPRL